MSQNIKWFKEIGIEDVAEVGGKNASLGERDGPQILDNNAMKLRVTT